MKLAFECTFQLRVLPYPILVVIDGSNLPTVWGRMLVKTFKSQKVQCKNFLSYPLLEENNIFGNISSPTNPIATKEFLIKLITFSTYTRNSKEIETKLTPWDHDQKHQNLKIGL